MEKTPSQGYFNGKNYVWVGYLNIVNDEFPPEVGQPDYRDAFFNRFQTWVSSSPWFHCQMVFWDNRQNTFATFSVQANQPSVTYQTYKRGFARGWVFQRIRVTPQQELTMYKFLRREYINKTPFNTLGAILLHIRPVDTGERSWFCSQLVAATLQEAGFLPSVRAYAVDPPNLRRLIAASGDFDEVVEMNPHDMLAEMPIQQHHYRI